MSNVRMMKQGDEADINLSWEDQDKINLFSKYNAKMFTLESQKDTKEKVKEDLDEILQEIELMDDEEIVKYRIGDSFFDFTATHAKEFIEQELEKTSTQLDLVKSEMESTTTQMEQLKIELYARFGNAINLERD